MRINHLKRIVSCLLATSMLLALAGCGGQSTAPQPSTDAAVLQSSADVSVPETPDAESPTIPDANGESILIAYFSMPEDLPTDGVVAIAGASIVVSEEEKLGNTQYVAQTIQQTIGGDLFRIETVEQYPLEHDALVDQAAAEQDADARPVLASQLGNLDQYDVIFLGYPNWWGDMPMPLYTFLESYDLSGKTIIPFITHGGSHASNTADTIAQLQPDATISDDPLVIDRGDVAASAADVTAWAGELALSA